MGAVVVAVGNLPVVAPATPSRGGGRKAGEVVEKPGGFGPDYGEEEDEEVRE